MSEMSERVAKAVQETASSMGSPFDSYVAAEVARAAIETMREPTEEMWKACEREQADFETGIGWQVMIDAALATETVS